MGIVIHKAKAITGGSRVSDPANRSRMVRPLLPFWIVAMSVVLGPGCRATPVAPIVVDTDAPDTDDPGPCPPGSPEHCVAFDGMVCTIGDGAGGPSSVPYAVFPDERIPYLICSGTEAEGFCGHRTVLSCDGEAEGEGWLSLAWVDGWEIDMNPDPLYGLGLTVTDLSIYDSENRSLVARGNVRMGRRTCAVLWYGDPAPIKCFYEWLDLFVATGNSCRTASVDVCDPDQCRIDTVTGFRVDDCYDWWLDKHGD